MYSSTLRAGFHTFYFCQTTLLPLLSLLSLMKSHSSLTGNDICVRLSALIILTFSISAFINRLFGCGSVEGVLHHAGSVNMSS